MFLSTRTIRGVELANQMVDEKRGRDNANRHAYAHATNHKPDEEGISPWVVLKNLTISPAVEKDDNKSEPTAGRALHQRGAGDTQTNKKPTNA